MLSASKSLETSTFASSRRLAVGHVTAREDADFGRQLLRLALTRFQGVRDDLSRIFDDFPPFLEVFRPPRLLFRLQLPSLRNLGPKSGLFEALRSSSTLLEPLQKASSGHPRIVGLPCAVISEAKGLKDRNHDQQLGANP